MGIPVEMLSKVFDLFTQVDRIYSRAQGGLGIGLTLVRSLVEMHGGSVEARSAGPGQGSEFLVRLPLAMRRRSAFEQSRTEGGTAATASRRILVLYDNRDSADSLGMLLKFLGADVCIANDGPAALEALETYQPSVVFLDIGMPGMDGYEVARPGTTMVRGSRGNADCAHWLGPGRGSAPIKGGGHRPSLNQTTEPWRRAGAACFAATGEW